MNIGPAIATSTKNARIAMPAMPCRLRRSVPQCAAIDLRRRSHAIARGDTIS